VNKIRSIIQWYKRWRGCNYRDLYRLVYGDSRILNDNGLTGEILRTRGYLDIWKGRHDELYERLEKIKSLHTKDKKFPIDCVSACKEGYPCHHYTIVALTEKKEAQ